MMKKLIRGATPALAAMILVPGRVLGPGGTG